MANKQDIIAQVDSFFEGDYEIKEGRTIPDVDDIALGKVGRALELAMLFIDIKESTKIVDSFRRVTAAKMYKSFLWGVAKIARNNGGELRSFNGDGVLVAFAGDIKCTQAAKTALQLNWFATKVVKLKVDQYLQDHKDSGALSFNCAIGVDVGNILVVRGGIRGENNNDLVWVGNATNYAVKLADMAHDNYATHISKRVYDRMLDTSKLNTKGDKNMWEKKLWTAMNDEVIYHSNWRWSV